MAIGRMADAQRHLDAGLAELADLPGRKGKMDELHRRGLAGGVGAVHVRLRHAAGRPIIARLQGLTPTGSETRLYKKADKTATLFWWADDIDAKSPELRASRIRLISVAAFKDEAARRGYVAELRDLPAPDPADERPRAPIELK